MGPFETTGIEWVLDNHQRFKNWLISDIIQFCSTDDNVTPNLSGLALLNFNPTPCLGCLFILYTTIDSILCKSETNRVLLLVTPKSVRDNVIPCRLMLNVVVPLSMNRNRTKLTAPPTRNGIANISPPRPGVDMDAKKIVNPTKLNPKEMSIKNTVIPRKPWDWILNPISSWAREPSTWVHSNSFQTRGFCSMRIDKIDTYLIL